MIVRFRFPSRSVQLAPILYTNQKNRHRWPDLACQYYTCRVDRQCHISRHGPAHLAVHTGAELGVLSMDRHIVGVLQPRPRRLQKRPGPPVPANLRARQQEVPDRVLPYFILHARLSHRQPLRRVSRVLADREEVAGRPRRPLHRPDRGKHVLRHRPRNERLDHRHPSAAVDLEIDVSDDPTEDRVKSHAF